MNTKGFSYIEVLIALTILVISMLSLLQAFIQSSENIKFAKSNYIVQKTAEMILDDVKGRLQNATLESSATNEFIFLPFINESIRNNNIYYKIFIKNGIYTDTKFSTNDFFFTNMETSEDYTDISIDFNNFPNINILEDVSTTRIVYDDINESFSYTSDYNNLLINFDTNNCYIKQQSFNNYEYVNIDISADTKNKEFNFVIENNSDNTIDVLIIKNPESNIKVWPKKNNNGVIFVNENFVNESLDISFETYLIKVETTDGINSQRLVDIVKVCNGD